MEGYSVTEAASVLGVPTERVWELLARGVLSGAPEGETGMRVFLQPRPAPAAPNPVRPNGDGGDREQQRELSPFRELLTEFRNLTERYGQALLALGEARGEVASLRSRVDVLEARMDLRLAGGSAAGSTQAGPLPAPHPATAAMPSADSARPSAAGEQRPETEVEHRIRRDSPRRATESFAEALARAQDPSAPELPGGPEAAAALSALRATSVAEAASAEAALPRELPPADEVPVAEEVTGPEEVAAVAEAAVAEDEAVAEQAGGPVEASAAAGEPPVEVEPVLEVEPVFEEVEGSEPPGVSAVEAREAEQEQAPSVLEADETAARETAVPDDRPAWQDDRYTAELGEPDWWEPEPTAAEGGPAEPPPSDATPAEPVADDVAPHERDLEMPDEPDPRRVPEAPAAHEEPEPAAAEEPVSEAAGGSQDASVTDIAELSGNRPPSGPPAGSQRATLTRLRSAPPRSDEETVMWFGRSPDAALPDRTTGDADEMEIAPTGRASTEAPDAGTRRLDDALAALDALSSATPSHHPAGPQPESADAPPPQPESPAARQPEPEISAPENREPQPPTPMRRSAPPARPLPPTTAGRAYRRLRRIFPG